MDQIVTNLDLNRLPALPRVLARLLRELNDDSLNLRNLVELISQDAALSLKVLAVTNSPLYRRQNPITSVEQSVNLLGLKMVRIIAVSASMQQFFNQFSPTATQKLNQFWQHSLTCAFLSRMIASSVSYPDADEAYFAGLLHDVGQLAMIVADAEEYSSILDSNQEDEALLDLERKWFGVSHCELGMQLIEHWELDPLLAQAVRHHHDEISLIRNAPELVKIVLLANAMSRLGIQKNCTAIPMANALFGIAMPDAMRLIAEAHASVEKLSDLAPSGTTPAHHPTRADTAQNGRQNELQRVTYDAVLLSEASAVFDQDQDEQGLISSILKTATILFEPRSAYVFEWDSDSNLVTGRPVENQPQSISRIRFPLEPKMSLIADSLLWGTVTHSCSKHGNVVCSLIDEQLLKLAEADDLYCIPMHTQQFTFGALVLAFPMDRTTHLDGSVRCFMEACAKRATRRIDELRKSKMLASSVDRSEVELYKTQVRQTVHEASNPLAILKNYLKSLDMKLADAHIELVETRILNEELDRVATIIRKLTNPPEDVVSTRSALNINSVIHEMVTLHEKSLFSSHNIRVETHLDHQLPEIVSNPQSIKQVLVNLFKNAAEAMPHGGMLTVLTAAVVRQTQHDSISIIISDTGPGIPKEIFGHLFSPVKSTKGLGNSGIGLSITSSIVTELGGTITCKTAHDQGTTFEIILPRTPEHTQHTPEISSFREQK